MWGWVPLAWWVGFSRCGSAELMIHPGSFSKLERRSCGLQTRLWPAWVGDSLNPGCFLCLELSLQGNLENLSCLMLYELHFDTEISKHRKSIYLTYCEETPRAHESADRRLSWAQPAEVPLVSRSHSFPWHFDQALDTSSSSPTWSVLILSSSPGLLYLAAEMFQGHKDLAP